MKINDRVCFKPNPTYKGTIVNIWVDNVNITYYDIMWDGSDKLGKLYYYKDIITIKDPNTLLKEIL